MRLNILLFALLIPYATAIVRTLNLDGVGKVSFKAVKQSANVHGIFNDFGSLSFQHGPAYPKSGAVELFTEGLNDPSMFMTSPNDRLNLPYHLAFAVAGNITADISGVQVNCGTLHIGASQKPNLWWFGSPQCGKQEVDPVPSPPPALPSGLYGGKPHPPPQPKQKTYQLVCPCENGTYVQFTQPDKKIHKHLDVDINDCTAIDKKVGQWVQVGSSPGTQSYEFDYGVERSYTVQKTQTWGRSTTVSVTVGFSFAGFSASTTVSHEWSYQFSIQHSSTFSMSEMEKYTTTVGKGVIWQFQMGITDNCGTSGIHMKDVQVTPDAHSPPCCLPGYFKNISEPWGDCVSLGGIELNGCKHAIPKESAIVV